jgi:hypothetical protein
MNTEHQQSYLQDIKTKFLDFTGAKSDRNLEGTYKS